MASWPAVVSSLLLTEQVSQVLQAHGFSGLCICIICVTNSHAEFLLIMASGPFSTLDSLEYSPLKELLEVVKLDRPSILLLVCTLIYWYTGLVDTWTSMYFPLISVVWSIH